MHQNGQPAKEARDFMPLKRGNPVIFAQWVMD
jgi:hypothetical protein